MSPCASASGESWKGLDAFHWIGPQLALTGEPPHAELKELAFFSRITLTKSCLLPRLAPGPNEKMGTEILHPHSTGQETGAQRST